MADRNIVTQVGIEDLKFALNEIAENLSAHINDTVTKAHGWNMINGYVDQYGNDLTTYQDSLGNVMGNYFLRLTIDDTVYYAPANVTSLEGQAETNGSIDTSADGEFEAQGGSSWVTDYTSDQVAQAEAINNDVLVQHSRVPHWEAHGGMTVTVQNTFNTLGGLVGSHVVQVRYDSNVYQIPVHTRLGGPIQAPRFELIPTITFQGPTNGEFGLVGTDLIEAVEGGEEWPDSATYRTVLSGGTFPLYYEWQFSTNNVDWVPFYTEAGGVKTPVSRSINNCGYSPISGAFGTLSTAVSNFDAIFDLETPGGDDEGTFFMRLMITGPAGTTYGTTIRVLQKDEGGGCFITTAVSAATGLPDDNDYLMTLRGFRESYMRPSVHGRHLLDEYDIIAPKIVVALKSLPNFKQACETLFSTYIEPAVTLVKAKRNGEAFGIYCRMVRDLQTRFGITIK